jgi:hypothetical protein
MSQVPFKNAARFLGFVCLAADLYQNKKPVGLLPVGSCLLGS